jgi:hypothetical protein
MAAKRRDPVATHNERTKLFASFLNALAIGLIGFAVLRPLTETPISVTVLSVWWGLAGLVLHASSHYILRYLMKGG